MPTDIHEKLPFPPLRKIFACRAYWALQITHIGGTWGMFTLLTAVPTYLNNIQHVTLAEVSIYMTLLVFNKNIFMSCIVLNLNIDVSVNSSSANVTAYPTGSQYHKLNQDCSQGYNFRMGYTQPCLMLLYLSWCFPLVFWQTI